MIDTSLLITSAKRAPSQICQATGKEDLIISFILNFIFSPIKPFEFKCIHASIASNLSTHLVIAHNLRQSHMVFIGVVFSIISDFQSHFLFNGIHTSIAFYYQL